MQVVSAVTLSFPDGQRAADRALGIPHEAGVYRHAGHLAEPLTCHAGSVAVAPTDAAPSSNLPWLPDSIAALIESEGEPHPKGADQADPGLAKVRLAAALGALDTIDLRGATPATIRRALRASVEVFFAFGVALSAASRALERLGFEAELADEIAAEVYREGAITTTWAEKAQAAEHEYREGLRRKAEEAIAEAKRKARALERVKLSEARPEIDAVFVIEPGAVANAPPNVQVTLGSSSLIAIYNAGVRPDFDREPYFGIKLVRVDGIEMTRSEASALPVIDANTCAGGMFGWDIPLEIRFSRAPVTCGVDPATCLTYRDGASLDFAVEQWRAHCDAHGLGRLAFGPGCARLRVINLLIAYGPIHPAIAKTIAFEYLCAQWEEHFAAPTGPGKAELAAVRYFDREEDIAQREADMLGVAFSPGVRPTLPTPEPKPRPSWLTLESIGDLVATEYAAPAKPIEGRETVDRVIAELLKRAALRDYAPGALRKEPSTGWLDRWFKEQPNVDPWRAVVESAIAGKEHTRNEEIEAALVAAGVATDGFRENRAQASRLHALCKDLGLRKKQIEGREAGKRTTSRVWVRA